MTNKSKQDLINIMSEAAEISKAAAERALNAVLEAISDTVRDGFKVQLPSFGSFERGERAARTGRNPQTGAEIKIPASKTVKFKTGKKFKDAVNV